MQIFATLLIAASAVLAQQVGSSEGPAVSNGETAVSNPNVNNGWQAQNSLFSSGETGGNVFSGLKDNKFSSSVSNTATNDNNFVNPSQSLVSGNTGSTTNGEHNQIGDIVSGAGQFAPIGGWGAFRKRDAIFNNGYDRGYPVAFYGHPYEFAHVAAPVYAHPGYAHPGYVQPGYPVGGAVNHNFQDASIVQNQARGGW
ncbi:hypothetical protein GGI15_002417 [Coemansia interrupta]|uniref:Secreted protein n=1 Tax=Coemansia interrupta TaxID=1126814 RepID=A0A9W8HF51_9FUNG|nr:hypothetical protein GGI15_002417 [Coemansia interrupta]